MQGNCPIHVSAKPYNGKDPKKRAQFQAETEAANKIEDYLCKRYVEGKPQTLLYFDIAHDLNIDEAMVAKLLKRFKYSSNGITF